ncbi:acyltransferase family protein [Fibrobacter sp. UWEL]|uniref:acyltransferase family protein n=1 Tax=Fibrobacter sp. UWEL TaxID=1896209 RepID=UPI00091ECF93|nr:acyltransferase family protein [Fibrobacter sp. UWEL]SHL55682.1 Fucose 4-O-acetylase [Fibrobacter sp. UWEL]
MEIEYKSRNPTFDVLKGIGIIFVILGHTPQYGSIRHLIFSFHMPLFFFISGYLMKERSIGEECVSSAKGLLLPYAITSCCLCFFSFVFFDRCSLGKNTSMAFFSALWGGSSWTQLSFFESPLYIGPLWFLCALFFVRIIYSIMQRIGFTKHVYISSVFVLCIAALAKYFVAVGENAFFSFFPALGALSFFHTGILLRKYKILERFENLFPVCCACWIWCMGFSNVELHANVYSYFVVIDIMAALMCFFMLFKFVENFYDGKKIFWFSLRKIGRCSLFILCVHSFDHCLLVQWRSVSFWEASSTCVEAFRQPC